MAELTLEDFEPDAPWTNTARAKARAPEDLIAGVEVEPLIPHGDDRGHLVELMTRRDDPGMDAPHIYQVFPAPGSVRAWVYHDRQSDRLHFTNGRIRLALYDLRPDSPTYRKLNVLDVGEDNPCRVTIPPFVVHGLANVGSTRCNFVNCPTNVYDPGAPDKMRLAYPDDRIPFRFD